MQRIIILDKPLNKMQKKIKNTSKQDKYQLNALVRRSIQVYVKVYFMEMTGDFISTAVLPSL